MGKILNACEQNANAISLTNA